MKIKLLISSIIFLFIFEASIAEKYSFEVNKIISLDNGKTISGFNGKILNEDKDLSIDAKEFKYFKDLNVLEASDGEAIIVSESLKINFKIININNNSLAISAENGVIINDIKNSLNVIGEKIFLDRSKNILTATGGIQIKDIKNEIDIKSEKIVLDRSKNILTATGGVQIKDIKNEIDIESEKIVLDKKKNIIFSNSLTKLKDKNKNKIQTNSFEYNFIEKNVKISKALILDNENNRFKIEKAYIDLFSNNLIGENIKINLNKEFMGKENEPRLIGKEIKYKGNTTEILNGSFTACKETDNCPPWQLSANKIIHDKEKKRITYDNVWLELYDVPVAYFPKFFHPDPTVKRQSGFLMPTFKGASNNDTYFSVPYYYVLSENRDTTFTPRLYGSDKFLLQNEYRKVNKSSSFVNDLSIFSDERDKIQGHLFLNLNKKLNFNKYENSNFDLTIEQASKNNYLKKNKIESPIINDYELLETSLKMNLGSENLNIDTSFLVYEKLNQKNNHDKYEYIFPKIELYKRIQNKTKLDGNFNFNSDNYIYHYDTNIYERVNTNNLVFNSKPKISNKGINNNYEFIIKNSNTNSNNSISHKENADYYISGLFQFNSSYPLIKKKNSYRKLLRPKMSLKFSPNNTRDISHKEYKIDVNNIFNLDRISSSETLEGGVSLAYGSDYVLTNENNNREIFSLKLANNLRINENRDIERNNQLGAKTSNFFGEITYSPLESFSSTYKFSTLNNLSNINYQNLITELKFNNFTNTIDYLRQDGDKNSYFLNKTTYKFDETKSISFSTRENLKSDLTEYYNLIYQYENDCLIASIEYQKDYYNDSEIRPSENIFVNLTIIPFGTTKSPNLK